MTPNASIKKGAEAVCADRLTPRAERIWLLVVVVALVSFHAFVINLQSFFVDEMNELKISQLAISELVVYPDSMPPLYPMLLKGWLAAWQTDAAARWLSALFSILTVASVWWFLRRLISPRAAIASATVLALLPLQLYYSQFVRSYSLVAFWAALSLGLFALAARENSRRSWVSFTLVAVLGMFTHYYFALLLASLGIIWVFATRGRVSWPFVMSVLSVALLASPVVVCLKSDFEYQKHLRDSRPLDSAAAAYTYASFFSGYSLGPSKRDLQTMSTGEATNSMLPWGIGIVGCTGPLLLAGFADLRRHRLALALLAICILPILMTGLLGYFAGITYNIRFIAWITVPLAVLLGVGIMAGHRNLPVRIGTAGLLSLALVAIGNRHLVDRYQNEDLRGAAEYIAANASPGDRVLIVAGYLKDTLDYYLPDDYEIIELPEAKQSIDSAANSEQAEQSIAGQLEALGGVKWLVYSRPFHGDPEGVILRGFERQPNVYKFGTSKGFAGVELIYSP